MHGTLHRIARKVHKQHARKKRTSLVPQIAAPAAGETSSAHARSVVVLGPYPNRQGFRLILKEDGTRSARCFATLEEAQHVRDELLREASRKTSVTVGELLEDFRRYTVEIRGAKPESAAHVIRSICSLIPAETRIGSLTPDSVRAHYLALTQQVRPTTGRPLSVSTHQATLTYAKTFGKWAVEAKHLGINPFAGIRPIGKRPAGKLQHTVSEALKLDALALSRAQAGDQKALGILMMIHLGMRSGEVSARRVRDVDEEGAVVWIPSGKTHNARRRLKVAEFLRPLLHAHTAGKAPDDSLFVTATGKPAFRTYFWIYLRTLCADAGVPVVCPHSLRGLHATLALEAGATPESVARALGHGSFSMTKKHYATADSVTANLQQRVSRAMGTETRERISSLLSSLNPTETEELKRQLALA